MKKIYSLLCAFLLAVLGVNFAPSTAYAAQSTVYTTVTDDLSNDASFNVSDYPVVSGDRSLNLITLSEGSSGELFVYVYQPSGQSGQIEASSINISVSEDGLSYYNYKLTLCDSSGTLYKYKVDDFVVGSAATRYYYITSIYRPFDIRYDSAPTFDNTIAEVNYAVSKRFCFWYNHGVLRSSVVDMETIEVTDKFVGYVRYPDGFYLGMIEGACDSHFVAFSTDKAIEKLFEADVCYVKQTYTRASYPLTPIEETYTPSDPEPEYAYLDYRQTGSYTGKGIGAATFRWDRIETTEKFLANIEAENVYTGAVVNVTYGIQLNQSAREEIESKQWVLRFLETPYSFEHYSTGNGMYQSFEERSFIGEVTILRLKFETDGVTYNLGVIDNKQTGSVNPVNSFSVELSPGNGLDLLGIILGLLLLIAILVLCAPLLPYIAKGIAWIISAPFKLIKTISKRMKKNRGKKK